MTLKKWLIVIFSFLSTTLVSAQGVKILELHGGYLNPKGIEAGFIFGGNYGISIDERVGLSLGVSLFHKNYQKESAVADTNYVSGVHETTVMKELEYNTTLVPISANVNIRIPFQPPLYWYLAGGVSYQFLFNTENNLEKQIKEKRNYRGFGWIARAGIEYTIGSRSSVILEAFYNNCRVKGNKEKKEGLPIWDEVDVSGLGFRAGLRLELF